MKISILRQTKEALDGVLDLKAFDVKTTHVPTEDDSLVNKAYVDSVAAGLDVKASVVVATTTTDGPLSDGNLELGTGGLLTIDGVTLTAGDRVLVKNQTDPTENGIYVADAGAWSRSDDQDGTPLANVSSGNFTFVEQGTLNSGTGWVLGGDGILSLGTDALNWSQFSEAGQVNAGFGLNKLGNLMSVDASDFADAGRGVTWFDDGGNDKLAIDGNSVAGAGLQGGGSAWQVAVLAAPSNLGTNLAGAINVDSNGVSVLVDNATISANGSSQLFVPDEGISEAKLDILDTPSDGEVLTWNNGSGRMEWRGVDDLVTDPNNKLIQFTFQRVSPGAGQINVGSAKDLSTALAGASALSGSDILVFSNGILLQNGGPPGGPGYTFNAATPSITLVDANDGNNGLRYFDNGDIISVVVLAK